MVGKRHAQHIFQSLDTVSVSCKVGCLFEIMANILENVEELIGEYQVYLAEKLLATGLAVPDPQVSRIRKG